MYVDVTIAFGWVHGTAMFQLYSDAIASSNFTAILMTIYQLLPGL